MKLLKSFAAASLFSVSLVVACGGSSQTAGNTNDAGTTPTVDSGPLTDAAGTTDATGPACTTTSNCSTGQTCCLNTTGTRTCVTGMCMGASVGCQSTGDCQAMGQVCCGSFSGTSAASTCQAAPCAAGAYEICTPGSTTQCPTGEVCTQPVAVVPIGYCAAPPADAGPKDAGGDTGSDMDSGSDSSTDAAGE